jgi:hypothetical protein
MPRGKKLIAEASKLRQSQAVETGLRQVGSQKAEHSVVQSVEPVLFLSTFSKAL